MVTSKVLERRHFGCRPATLVGRPLVDMQPWQGIPGHLGSPEVVAARARDLLGMCSGIAARGSALHVEEHGLSWCFRTMVLKRKTAIGSFPLLHDH